MIFIAILLIMWGLGILAYHLFKPHKKNECKNPYIKEHEKKLKDDELYEKYMDWCFRHGEAPMDKKGFEAIRDKEKYIDSFMRKY